MKKLVLLVLVFVLTFLPYSLNITNNVSSAQSTVSSEHSRNVALISSNDNMPEIIKDIKEQKKDDSLKKIREMLGNDQINIKALNAVNTIGAENNTNAFDNTNRPTDFVVNVKELRKNASLQGELGKAISNGSYVYIYGETTQSEFMDLLNISSIKVPFTVNGNKVIKELHTDKDASKIKGTETKRAMELKESEKRTTSIFGYTLNQKAPSSYIEININSYDNKGNKRENSEEVYIQEVLNHQAERVEALNKESGSKTSKVISKNKTLAATRVDSSYGYTASVYGYNDTLTGRVETDYVLYKSSDEDSTYDYFSLKPYTQMREYNGSAAQKLKVDIDIPYDSDHLEDWSPYGDESGSSQSVQLVYPFSISWTQTWDDSVDIDDQSSRYYDYARWVVTDGDLNQQDYRPGAGWASSGTYASSDLRVYGTFYVGSNNQYPAVASQKIDVNYNY